MNYLLLISEPRGQREARTETEGQAAYAQMLDYAQMLQNAGKLRGVDSLQGDARGRRVQVRDGQTRAIDGPFSESKEMIGGYFLVDCETLDEATALAARCPAAGWATVEVRPVGPCFL
jgi:hypothetical protein